MLKKGLNVLLLCAVPMLLSGCASQISHHNFLKIRSGMSETRVAKLLGEPNDVVGGGLGLISGSYVTWESDDATISVQFVNSKVRGKQFTKH
jgi:hypothetical protein